MMEVMVEKEADIRARPVVLWMSRHRPLPAQLDFLGKKLGEFELKQYGNPIPTAEKAVEIAREMEADYVVPVLPLWFIVKLVEASKFEDFTILKAEMVNIHNCSEQPCPDYNPATDTIMHSVDFGTGEKIHRHFRFDRFVILEDIEIKTRVWI